jgi:uncharacterized protein
MTMRFSFLLLIAFLVRTTVVAQTYAVATVPNTKVSTNSYVSNPDGIISDGTVATMNGILKDLEQKTTAQVAVVLLASIGEETDVDFAQQLFEHWGIGKAAKDNGLLILYVKDQRTIRFHTGFGVEGVLPDAVCKRIQLRAMVPHFKEGNTDAGMLAGVEEVSKLLTDPTHAEELYDDSANVSTSDVSDQAGVTFLFVSGWVIIGLMIYFSKRKDGFYNSPLQTHDVPRAVMRSGTWWLLIFFGPIILTIMLAYAQNWFVYIGGCYAYICILGLIRHSRIAHEADQWLTKKEYHATHIFLTAQKSSALFMAFLFPLPYVFVHALLKSKRNNIRSAPRACVHCGQKSERLSEAAEDEYLAREAQFEESLESVDYDVWKCTVCDKTSLEAYINEKTKYTECPKCKTYAFHTMSSHTIVSATTSHSGKEEITEVCAFCNHKKVTQKKIPRIVVSSSSDSGSSSSSGSSGGSFGGGSSGGGGASSSW